MRLATAFLRLIRWPNLVFIALTQLLFYYCIVQPALSYSQRLYPEQFTQPLLYLLVLASVLIAAAGYIINDYFDINIDQVNKPAKMVVEKIITRRWAILWHLVISVVGILVSMYVAYKTSWLVGIANIACVLLLWFYSTSFKKTLLTGNIIIAALTAWTVMVLYVAINSRFWNTHLMDLVQLDAMKRIFKFACLYAGFAFIISLIREVVKDIEDMEGDSKYNCRTMPIVWGVPAAKVFAGVWMVVLVGGILLVQLYVLHSGWWWSAVYCIALLVLPMLWILKQFYLAQNAAGYHRISTYIKWIMLLGILSMLLVRLYLR
ncbi:MAG: hypothetical protein RL172_130 [Bacteroidota bacterium]|jgi:4-hydroxybenzoate polyprenyltransferase